MFPQSSNHTHPKSAGLRSSVNHALKVLARSVGMEPYEMSSSARDDDADASRYFYDTKDLKQRFRDHEVGENHVLLYIDVDYHCDINAHLKYARPMMLYTFVPKQAAKRTNEYHYTFEKNNTVKYNVAGGAHYVHELWDYRGDCVAALDNEDNMVVFDVVQKELTNEKDHRIVILTPSAMLPYPYWLPYYSKEQFGIRRRTLVHGKSACVIEPCKDAISLASPGDLISINLSLKTYLTVQAKTSRNTGSWQTD